jgi:hypothetical protein
MLIKVIIDLRELTVQLLKDAIKVENKKVLCNINRRCNTILKRTYYYIIMR